MNTTTRVNVTSPDNLDRALRHAASKMNPESSWANTLFDISNADTQIDGGAKKRALRSWASKGDRLNTLQVTMDMADPDNPKLEGAWSPGERTVVAEGPTYLTWETGSVAELRGMIALRASDDIWVGGYEWGANRLVLVIYRRETGQ